MIAKIWSGENKLYWLLVPLSLVYGLVVFVRRILYQCGIFKSWRSPIPVIIVGNLSVGGNGKTPVVIYLVEQLKANGYNVGVVARGYGGKSDHYPVIVTKQTPPAIVGDEPVLIYERTHIPFAVAPKRSEAIKALLNEFKLDVIITDDGLQHYALDRDIEIVVIDGNRGFGNGWFLPAGPMRESTSRLKQVDYTLINGNSQKHYIDAYTMQFIPDDAINLLTQERKPISQLHHVCAMAGIGDPSRFFTMLEKQHVDVVNTIPFMDHQQYTEQQLSALTKPNELLLMTEKDAVKCFSFAKDNWWYLPINAALPDKFMAQLLTQISKIRKTD